MLKLRIINKPKMYKLKCNFAFPNIILANMQEKEVTPTKEIQEVVPDIQYDGLSKITINPIPDEYIIPKLGSKQITENGIYKASDDNLDGYSSAEVATSGVDINDYYDLTKRTSGGIVYYIKQIPMIDTSDYTRMNYMFNDYPRLTTIPLLNTSKVTDMSSMFSYCPSLTTIPLLDTSKVTNMSSMFNYCPKLAKIPQLNTSKVTAMSSMFNDCKSLTTIPLLDTNKVTSVYSMVNYCSSLTTLGGFTNLGQAYSTTQGANYYNYTLNLSFSPNLTHDSLINVINGLYDIASAGVQPQQLVLGSANLAKLTSEEIAIATNKGWTVG